MSSIKWSNILRPLGLFKPAEMLVGSFGRAGRKFKYFVYKHKVAKFRKQRKFMDTPSVLIAIRDDGIGNSIEATPLVQAVRILWPAADITLLVPDGDLYCSWCVPDVITTDVESLKQSSFDHTFLPFYSTWKTPDWLGQVDHGQIHKPKTLFDRRCLKPEREYNLDAVRQLGYSGPTPPLYVSVKQPDAIGKPEGKRICILPGGKTEARWQNKKWPYYYELSKLIIEKHPDVEICIIGTLDDTVPEDLLAMDKVTDLRGKLTLAQTAWVLRNSDLAVGNDCGPMHIADAVGTKGAVIFGPTCDMKNSPANKIKSVFLDIPCRPCQYDGPITCQDPKCIKDISADQVMETLEKLMSVS